MVATVVRTHWSFSREEQLEVNLEKSKKGSKGRTQLGFARKPWERIFSYFCNIFHNRRFSITRATTTTLHGTASTLMYFQRQSDLCFTHNAIGIGAISEKKQFDMSLGARGLSQDCQIGLIKFLSKFQESVYYTNYLAIP